MPIQKYKSFVTGFLECDCEEQQEYLDNVLQRIPKGYKIISSSSVGNPLDNRVIFILEKV